MFKPPELSTVALPPSSPLRKMRAEELELNYAHWASAAKHLPIGSVALRIVNEHLLKLEQLMEGAPVRSNIQSSPEVSP